MRDIRRRTVDLFDIVGRRKASKAAVASPLDFELHYADARSVESGGSVGIAYCADVTDRRMLFTLSDDENALFDEPFLYLAQHQRARQIVSVPFEQLNSFVRGSAGQPTFIFSVGRCGSTLLASLLNGAGLPAVSEPDVFTQLATIGHAGRAALGDGNFATVARACVANLSALRGERFVIKLRSQCNGIATEIAKLFPAAKYVFVLRERNAWARSRFKAFGGQHRALSHMYKWSVDSYRRLSSRGFSTQLIWYEDFVQNPLTELERLREFGLPIRVPEACSAQSILARDAQGGTWLASSELGSRELSSEQLRTFNDEWAQIRPSLDIDVRGGRSH